MYKEPLSPVCLYPASFRASQEHCVEEKALRLDSARLLICTMGLLPRRHHQAAHELSHFSGFQLALLRQTQTQVRPVFWELLPARFWPLQRTCIVCKLLPKENNSNKSAKAL